MTLLIRAQVASAAHDVVPSWPLDSFIAVNPLAGSESHPFGSVPTPGVAFTRSPSDYLADLHRNRITMDSLQTALVRRVPALRENVTLGAQTMAASAIAAIDMTLIPDATAPAPSVTATAVDEYLSTWIAAYLNPDPLWAMPHRERGFYAAWRMLAVADPALPRRARRTIARSPEQPEVALAQAVDALGGSEDPARLLRSHLAALPGWVGHIKWRAEKVGDIDLTSYLAVRLAVISALGADASAPSAPTAEVTDDVWSRAQRVAEALGTPDAQTVATVARVLAEHPSTEHALTWQAAYEETYRSALLASLASTGAAPERPEVQVVMCIDPRSEGMRRQLELDETVETYGFAGFFGVPIRFSRHAARRGVDALPALLAPRHHVTERPRDEALAKRSMSARRGRDAVRRALHAADAATATPFAFAETAGWFYGARTGLRTLAPGLYARIGRALSASRFDAASDVTVADTFALDERVALAEAGVRMMGLDRFAPLVVLAGHGSRSTNNLYESALDCGACGGNPGAANARAAASIFNDRDVRAALELRGIRIPDDAFFVAAEHNTVSDTVQLLDEHLIPPSHAGRVEQFIALQRDAAARLVAERAQSLPGGPSRRPITTVARARRRAHDWAEVYPELGLIGNAGMIIAPRELTRGVDLSRRVFLHSYRPAMDPDGTALETVMTAPVIVAQWINHQYYFSSLNPETLGAGTKTIHNAIGTAGVLSGQSGDLRRGLPWQSVGFGRDLLHEPMRLSVIVQAPLERVGRIVSSNQVLRNLLDNDWISLTARRDSETPWQRYTPYGWAPVSSASTNPSEGTHQ
ncbi:MAG: DUF2309 domain-containing protein [Rhodoglobus sp.]